MKDENFKKVLKLQNSLPERDIKFRLGVEIELFDIAYIKLFDEYINWNKEVERRAKRLIKSDVIIPSFLKTTVFFRFYIFIRNKPEAQSLRHFHCEAMMNRFLSVRCAGAVLFCSIAMSAQDAAPAKTLVVNGHASPGAVVQMNGKSYVDVEAFAQAVDATVRFEANKVILTMAAAPAAPAQAEKPAGLSREFSQAGIAALSDMREWRGGIASALRFGVAAGNWLGPWLQDYQVKAQKSLDQASLAAKTDSRTTKPPNS